MNVKPLLIADLKPHKQYGHEPKNQNRIYSIRFIAPAIYQSVSAMYKIQDERDT